MSKLDNLIEAINEYTDGVFDYNKQLHELMDQFNELSFIGEIDHGIYYLTQVEQIYKCDSNGCDQLYTLTYEERENYYKTGKLPKEICCYKIASSVHWYVNPKEKFVKVFVNRNTIKSLSTPKEDYGKIYEEFSKKKWSETAQFKLDEIDDNVVRNTFNKIIKVMEFSKMHELPNGDWDFKVQQDMAKYWGNISQHIVDDEYQETLRPELIKIPHKHKTVSMMNHSSFIDLLMSPGFDDIDWDNIGNFNISFDNALEAENFFYSAIDYINNARIKPTVHPTREPQLIKKVEKHYLSGKWPTAATQEEAYELEKKLTKYEVNVTKFHDDIVIRMQVWEFGIVYFVTNLWTPGAMN